MVSFKNAADPIAGSQTVSFITSSAGMSSVTRSLMASRTRQRVSTSGV